MTHLRGRDLRLLQFATSATRDAWLQCDPSATPG
jgi:hypothetical protein